MVDYRLTNLDTHEEQTFSNLPGGLRPLHLLEVPFVQLSLAPGQVFNRACAAACGLALLKACKPDDPTTLEVLQGEMEAAPGPLTIDRLRAALEKHAISSQYETGLDVFDLFSRLQSNKPLILLLDFSMLVAAGLTVALETEETRFVILIGMDNHQACVHDPAAPSGAGASLCLPLTSFEVALRSAVTAGNGLFAALTPVLGLNDPAFGRPPLYTVRTLDSINIRSGPAKSYADIGDVPGGVEKAIYEESPDRTYGRIAPGQWITLDPQWVRRTTGISGAQVGLPYRVRVIRPINIRSGPAKTYADIGDIGSNAERTILEESADKTYGKIGENMWITLDKTYVMRLPESLEKALPPRPSFSPYRVRVKRSIYIRSGPAQSYPSVGGLTANVERTILAENSDRSYGQIAPGQWITLRPAYVRKV